MSILGRRSLVETVGFTRMKDGTREDYKLLGRIELDYISRLADRLLADLELEKDALGGYQVTRYEHCLQAATRAARAGESEEYVVATLFHDIGDRLAPDRHGEMAAAVLEPYVSDEIAWIVRHLARPAEGVRLVTTRSRPGRGAAKGAGLGACRGGGHPCARSALVLQRCRSGCPSAAAAGITRFLSRSRQ